MSVSDDPGEDFDGFLSRTGTGLFQVKLISLLYGCSALSCAVTFVDVFTNFTPPYRCASTFISQSLNNFAPPYRCASIFISQSASISFSHQLHSIVRLGIQLFLSCFLRTLHKHSNSSKKF